MSEFRLADLDNEAAERINTETIEGGNSALDDAAESVDARAALERAAELSDFDYGRKRKEIAKEIGIPASTLDRERRELRRNRDDSENLPFTEIDQWEGEVNGSSLARGICDHLKRYISFSDESATAAAIWILFAWTHDAVTHSPLLLITSPEKDSGKTTLLGLLRYLAPRGIRVTGNTSQAAIMRVITKWNVTLMLDEADEVFSQNNFISSLFNDGWTRDGGEFKCNSDSNDPEYFVAFAPKVIGMKGNKILDTTLSRAITIQMRRMLPGESKEDFEYLDSDYRRVIRSMCAKWAVDNIDSLRGAKPKVPENFRNRLRANWCPLFAIAELIGDGWPDRLRAAAVALSPKSTDSLETILLGDIYAIFSERMCDKIPTVELLGALHAIEGRPWNEFGRMLKPMSARQLSDRLKGFEIFPATRRDGKDTFKGYVLDNYMQDAFTRYLGSPEPSQRHNADEMEVSTPSASVTQFPDVTAKKSEKGPLINDCDGVTGENTKTGVVIDYPTAPEAVCDHCGQTGAHIIGRHYRGFTANLHNECRDVWEEDRDTDLSAANGPLGGKERA